MSVARARTRVCTCLRQMNELNDCVEVRTHACPLDESNALEIISQYDIVVDARYVFTSPPFFTPPH